MDYDRLIPLAILGVLVAGLVAMVRWAREPDRVRSDASSVPPPPIALPVAEPVQPSAPAEQVAFTPPPAEKPVAVAGTPIENVLAALKKEDALQTAFVLSEILAPPVSLRR
jgi:hypothetical protein